VCSLDTASNNRLVQRLMNFGLMAWSGFCENFPRGWPEGSGQVSAVVFVPRVPVFQPEAAFPGSRLSRENFAEIFALDKCSFEQ